MFGLKWTKPSLSGYLGNEKIKAAGTVTNFTPKQLEEYIRCSTDYIYFIENYVHINTEKGIRLVKLWDFQVDYIHSLHNHRFNIAKLPRQVGKTTCTTAYLIWYCLFGGEAKTVAILGQKLENATKILMQFKDSYELIPKWLQLGVKKWQEKSVIFENGTKVIASATTKKGIRGETVDVLYLDEFAHVDYSIQQQFMEAVYPTTAQRSDSKIIITSTPKGLELFYSIWRKSELGENAFERTAIHWSQVPGRDEKWKQETIKNTSELLFRQEFECQFLGSANTLIDGEKIAMLIGEKPISLSEGGHLKIFREPDPNRFYIVCVDVSEGVGGDYSAITVIDVSALPYRVVATYRCNTIHVMQFPSVIYRIATAYNKAHVLIELNNNGDQVANILFYDHEYENMFAVQTKKGNQSLFIEGSKDFNYGVKMTKAVKKVGCSTLKTLVEMDRLVVSDQTIIEEFANFVEHGSSHRAAEGHHDDLTMTLVSFSWLTVQDYFKEIFGGDIEKNIALNSQRFIEETTSSLPFRTDALNPDAPVPKDDWEREFQKRFYGTQRNGSDDLDLYESLMERYALTRDDDFSF